HLDPAQQSSNMQRCQTIHNSTPNFLPPRMLTGMTQQRHNCVKVFTLSSPVHCCRSIPTIISDSLTSHILIDVTHQKRSQLILIPPSTHTYHCQFPSTFCPNHLRFLILAEMLQQSFGHLNLSHSRSPMRCWVSTL